MPPDQSEMLITLNWPGSRLELAITDPQGQQVDANYPGATLVPYARMVHMILSKPLEGVWRLAVRGAEVPEGIIDYAAVVSVRQDQNQGSTGGTYVPAPPRQPINEPVIGLFLVILLGGALAVVIILLARQGGGLGGKPEAAVCIAGQPHYWAEMRRGMLRVGRDPRSDLVLTDSRVSRFHAQITKTPQGFLLEDLGSSNVTTINGRRIIRYYLQYNDVVRVGETDLIFWARFGR